MFFRAASLLVLTGVAFLQTSCCCCGGPSDADRARYRVEEQQEEQQRLDRQAADDAAVKAQWDSLPESERKFCEALTTAATAYQGADNDLKKSKVRRQRGEAIQAAVPRGAVSKWTGKVNTLTTTGDGNVVLTITLPCDSFTVGTWNNELSDIGDQTLISSKSSVYDTLAEMSVGDSLTFSGKFIDDDLNGFKGSSMTEFGSMTGEAFLFRF